MCRRTREVERLLRGIRLLAASRGHEQMIARRAATIGRVSAVNLRIPGPTPLPEPVREAAGRQMVNHRGPEFRELITRVTGRLQTAFRTRNDILILTASGTGGLEAAAVNHLSVGDSVLSVSIGSFGERFARICSTYGADVTRLQVEWGRAAEADDVRRVLTTMDDAGKPARAVLLTHNETSTGVENPLAELAAAVHEAAPDALLLVDAISGLGAVPFETDAWGLDVVVTGSQKSWMAPPGLAMISVSERAWQRAENSDVPRFYFDLAKARKSLANGETPWTPAVGVLFGLDIALEILEQEGYERIFDRHDACAAAARAGLVALGFDLVAPADRASRTVTAAWLPEGIEWADLNRAMRSRGLVVAGGQDQLAGRILRIGHLGSVEPGDVVAAIGIVGEALREVGAEADVQDAVDAARSASHTAPPAAVATGA